MAYWEISRDFYIPGIKKMKGLEEIGFHIEYNDGVQIEKPDSSETIGYNLISTWLTGISYPVKIGNLVIGTMLMYRCPRGATSADFQFTVVWYQPVLKGKLILTGFIDIWSQNKIYEDGKEIVFQTEPQFWFALNKNISFGSELEISKNFPFGPNDWKFQPTIAMKWEF
jgi:nucleoside-specific outer membrane channel protein Tsx